MDPVTQAQRSNDISTKVAQLFKRRVEIAQEHYRERMMGAWNNGAAAAKATPISPWEAWNQGYSYAVDATQRSILFWDTMRQRGNNYVEHKRQGQPPLLHFDYEMVMDGRKLERPVNYALVRIVPPEGVTVDPKRRPYVIIDPRAGHGPGIGGFKDDSQVGVALRAGHPGLFRDFLSRTRARADAARCLRRREAVRPQACASSTRRVPKPAIVGNCQGGWAAMMLAASGPGRHRPDRDQRRAHVVLGRRMGGRRKATTRCATRAACWAARGSPRFTADLGGGIFDGAYLVENFENLNPANTFWDKYYHLYANVDTEPPRFLEFERWWGGFYLMNREEIEWITRNLFVGNKVWKGGTPAGPGRRSTCATSSRRSSCSPPWATTSRRRSRRSTGLPTSTARPRRSRRAGQVIVGLMHENVGHLGIFVSGKVAKKEHAQIVSVLKSIEALPPGLYACDRRAQAGRRRRRVRRRVPRAAARGHRGEAQPLPARRREAVRGGRRLSEFNQRAYELFLQPLVQAMANEAAAKLRASSIRCACSAGRSPTSTRGSRGCLPAAEVVKAQARAGRPRTTPSVKVEKATSAAISASLDYYRAMRDAMSEAAFFPTYGNVFSLYVADKQEPRRGGSRRRAARVAVRAGGAALDRRRRLSRSAGARRRRLLARKGEPLPLARLG